MIRFLAANWLWIAVIVFFVAMHRSGHGCGMHGSHGGHGDHQRDDHQHGGSTGHQHGNQDRPAEPADADRSALESRAHGL